MAYNTLYQFLFGFKPPGITIEHGKNRRDVAYIRIPIATTDASNTPNLGLQNHHISIYSNEDSTNPFLSQYHYTSTITDNRGITWYSHVFFNERDSVIHSDHRSISPSMASSSTDPAIESQTIPLFLDEQIILIAEKTTKSIMGKLRACFTNKISSLEQDYQRLEKEASDLSVDPFGEEYRTKLEEICVVLQNLSPLVKHSYYNDIQKFISGLLHRVNRPAQAETHAYEANCSSSHENSLSFFRDAPVTIPKKHKKIPTIDSKANALIEKFESLKSAPFNQRAREFPDFFAQLNTFYLPQAYGRTAPLSASILIRLRQLHHNLLALGQQDFQWCLLKGDELHFELASKMKVFHQLLSAQNLELALHMGNSDLLEFILTYGDSSLIKMPVSVKDKVFRSSVHACVGLDDASTPMQNCLTVLLGHGASLYQRADNGLPLGHVILSNKKSTLRHGLNYLGSPLESPDFFTHLIACLTQRLKSQPEMDEIEKLYLNRSMEEYEYKKTIARSTKCVQQYSPSSYRDLAVSYKVSKDIPTILKQLEDDLDILRIHVIQCELEMEYWALCTKKDRDNWFKANKKYSQESLASARMCATYQKQLQLPIEQLKEMFIQITNSKIQSLQAALESLRKEVSLRKGKKASSSHSTRAGTFLTQTIWDRQAALSQQVDVIKERMNAKSQSPTP